MSICGEYDERGYRVIDGKSGDTLFTAGNHKSNPKRTVDPEHPEALCVSMIRRFCAKATRRISQERHANYGGIRRASIAHV